MRRLQGRIEEQQLRQVDVEPRDRSLPVLGRLHRNRFSRDWRISSDRRSFPAAIAQVRRGGGRLWGEDGEHRLQPGDVYSLPQGVFYGLASDPACGLEVLGLTYRGASTQDLVQARLGPGARRIATGDQAGNVRAQLLLMWRLAGSGGPMQGDALGHAFLLLLALLEGCRQTGSDADQGAEARFRACRAYMDAHLLESRDLGQVARAMGISDVHLCRLFRRFQGESPKRYLQRRQMEFAACLLAEGMQVQAVAAEVGYGDPFFFSRVFTRIMGCNPSRYRAW
jgi:AraC-like DNA-binding protein